MTLEERIERAADNTDASKLSVKMVIMEAFPELFDGTHWLAPMEPDEEMALAGFLFTGSWDTPDPSDAKAVFTAMRDAYLNREQIGAV